jgi:ligand-binding SRPBCC domain-containing protein
MNDVQPMPPLAPGVPELPPTITRSGGEYVLCCRLRVPKPRSEIFPFFSNARNLERLTPELLQFRILTEGEIKMQTGALIDYQIRIRGIPVRWRTRITAWEPPDRFEDTQLKGPYRQWIHEHAFVDEGDTTLMQDMVRYKVLGGRLVHALLVKRDVLKIFGYRKQILRDLWGDPCGE